ncbi:MAG: hypothetical protein RLZZ269_101, partial [Actinomycetota bacterium]
MVPNQGLEAVPVIVGEVPLKMRDEIGAIGHLEDFAE